METITNGAVPADQIEALVSFAQNAPGPEIQELLLSLARCLRDGDDIVALTPNATLTPNQAAARLGMSRTHLYKLLDNKAIPSHRVGRDRRILFVDLVGFEAQRQSDRRELAERFAHQDATHAAAVEEIADML